MTDTAQHADPQEVRLSPQEAICLNPRCDSVIAGAGAENPPARDWASPHFHHNMLVYGGGHSEAFGFGGLPRCPACGELALRACPYSVGPADPAARFPLGATSMSPGVTQLITVEHRPSRAGLAPLPMVDPALRLELFHATQAHARGEWPGATATVREANDQAIAPDVAVLVEMGAPDYAPRPFVLERRAVLSAPEINGQTVLIVTEAERHRTRTMLPEEQPASG